MFKWLRIWWNRRYKEPFTVAADRCLFYGPYNQREELFRVYGLANARSIARAWVYKHQHGAVRVLEGHHFWKNKEGKDITVCSDYPPCCDPIFHDEFNV